VIYDHRDEYELTVRKQARRDAEAGAYTGSEADLMLNGVRAIEHLKSFQKVFEKDGELIHFNAQEELCVLLKGYVEEWREHAGLLEVMEYVYRLDERTVILLPPYRSEAYFNPLHFEWASRHLGQAVWCEGVSNHAVRFVFHEPFDAPDLGKLRDIMLENCTMSRRGVRRD
jgi:hypothetical protein